MLATISCKRQGFEDELLLGWVQVTAGSRHGAIKNKIWLFLCPAVVSGSLRFCKIFSINKDPDNLLWLEHGSC